MAGVYEVKLFQFHELGRLLLKMTPLYTETASNGSGRLQFMRAFRRPRGGGTCHNVRPRLRHWKGMTPWPLPLLHLDL